MFLESKGEGIGEGHGPLLFFLIPSSGFHWILEKETRNKCRNWEQINKWVVYRENKYNLGRGKFYEDKIWKGNWIAVCVFLMLFTHLPSLPRVNKHKLVCGTHIVSCGTYEGVHIRLWHLTIWQSCSIAMAVLSDELHRPLLCWSNSLPQCSWGITFFSSNALTQLALAHTRLCVLEIIGGTRNHRQVELAYTPL